jgi:inorganic triphosphatase YgiF
MGLAARIRTSSGGRRLTLKSLARRGAGAVHRRLELEGDAGAGDDPHVWPPSDARDRLLDEMGGDPLTALATIRQLRLQRDVAVGSSVVELSLDEVQVAAQDGRLHRWTELECELRSGDEADLAVLGAVLVGRPGLEPARTSKLDRALAADRNQFTER